MLRRLLFTCLLAACSSSEAGSPSATNVEFVDGGAKDAATDSPALSGVELLAVADLPRTALTQALSATYFDESSGILFALQDTTAQIVALTPSADFRTWKVGAPLTLTARPDAAWDGEGLARTGDTLFAVTVETMPLLERFDLKGVYQGKVDLPARFASQAPGNKGLESLSITPSGKYLFVANEAALSTDGATATKTKGTLVRILRRDLASGTDEERAYRTEPLGSGTGGDMGVTDVTALADDKVLVLERGFQSGYGNTVRLFVVDLTTGSDVSQVASLDASSPVVTKTLLVDLSTLPSDGVTHPSTQPNPILDNYEALALGPTLPDGRRVVFVTSDDNASTDQVARVLALAIRL
jgi:Esterase-like activity of phytase